LAQVSAYCDDIGLPSRTLYSPNHLLAMMFSRRVIACFVIAVAAGIFAIRVENKAPQMPGMPAAGAQMPATVPAAGANAPAPPGMPAAGAQMPASVPAAGANAPAPERPATVPAAGAEMPAADAAAAGETPAAETPAAKTPDAAAEPAAKADDKKEDPKSGGVRSAVSATLLVLALALVMQ